MNMIVDLLEKTRTYRRFDNSKLVMSKDVESIVSSVRYAASAGNLQRIRYITVGHERAPEVFSHIALGGYLPKEKKPDAFVAPTSYILMLTETDTPDVNLSIDIGISAEAIVLTARELGIGSCMIRNFDKEYFSKLATGTGYSPILVIALGYPAEEVKIVSAETRDCLKYYKDENDVNAVPKLGTDALILKRIK